VTLLKAVNIEKSYHIGEITVKAIRWVDFTYAFTGHYICCVTGHLKYNRTSACPVPCICGTL